MWDFQVPALVDHGLRCITYDRRGHGRSDRPWSGYDYDTLADDLAALLQRLEVRDATLAAHSMGAGEAVRYLTRHGAARVSRMALVSGTTPFPMKTPDNPEAIDRALMEADLAVRTADRLKWFADNADAFFGVGLPGISVSPEFVQYMIRQCLDCSARAAAAVFLTGFTSDLRSEMQAVPVQTLIVHGDHDAQAPLDLCGRKAARLIPDNTLLVYENAAHGLFVTHALFAGLVHAVLVAAHVAEPAATTVSGLTPRRLWAASVAELALVAAVSGGWLWPDPAAFLIPRPAHSDPSWPWWRAPLPQSTAE